MTLGAAQGLLALGNLWANEHCDGLIKCWNPCKQRVGRDHHDLAQCPLLGYSLLFMLWISSLYPKNIQKALPFRVCHLIQVLCSNYVSSHSYHLKCNATDIGVTELHVTSYGMHFWKEHPTRDCRGTVSLSGSFRCSGSCGGSWWPSKLYHYSLQWTGRRSYWPSATADIMLCSPHCADGSEALPFTFNMHISSIRPRQPRSMWGYEPQPKRPPKLTFYLSVSLYLFFWSSRTSWTSSHWSCWYGNDAVQRQRQGVNWFVFLTICFSRCEHWPNQAYFSHHRSATIFFLLQWAEATLIFVEGDGPPVHFLRRKPARQSWFPIPTVTPASRDRVINNYRQAVISFL